MVENGRVALVSGANRGIGREIVLNALARILASELRGSGILVNSVCPGWVQTDMGGSGASHTVEEGADTPVWTATLPNNGPNGCFFRDRRQIPW